MLKLKNRPKLVPTRKQDNIRAHQHKSTKKPHHYTVSTQYHSKSAPSQKPQPKLITRTSQPIITLSLRHMSSTTTQHGLMTSLYKDGSISSKFLYDAFLKVDRKYFNPHQHPYHDRPYTIGASATISAPSVHAMGASAVLSNITNKFRRHTNHNNGDDSDNEIEYIPQRAILDVASGSGYQTALFGTIIKMLRQQFPANLHLQQSKVYGIDIHPSLVKQSIENVKNFDKSLIDDGIVEIYCTDAFCPTAPFKGGPFDVIHSGVAVPMIPLALLTQLKPTGSMVTPVETNHKTKEQQFYHFVRKPADVIDVNNLPISSKYRDLIKNDNDFFHFALQLQQQGSEGAINTFLDTFFTKKSLFRCAYLMALHDNVPIDIPALRVGYSL